MKSKMDKQINNKEGVIVVSDQLKDEWLRILKKDKYFDQELFDLYLKKNDENMVFALIDMRDNLLKMHKNDVHNFNCANDNLQNLFIEYIPEQKYRIILKCMKRNSWTVKEAYKEAVTKGYNLFSIVSCRNLKKVI